MNHPDQKEEFSKHRWVNDQRLTSVSRINHDLWKLLHQPPQPEGRAVLPRGGIWGTGTEITCLRVSLLILCKKSLGFHAPQHSPARGAPLPLPPSTAAQPRTPAPSGAPQAGTEKPPAPSTTSFTWHKNQAAAPAESGLPEKPPSF